MKRRQNSFISFIFVTLAINLSTQAAEVVSSTKAYTVLESLCSGFQQVQVSTMKDTCLGLVADKTQGLKMPRYSVQAADGVIYISDMGGWDFATGTVWALEMKQDSSQKTQVKLTNLFPTKKLTMPNGLLLDPEGRLYVGTPMGLYRFLPKDSSTGTFLLDSQLELIENGFMQSIFRSSEYTDAEAYRKAMKLAISNKHPLLQLAANANFTEIYFNVGAPSDRCNKGVKTKNQQGFCVQSDSALVNAGIWKVNLSADSSRKKISVEAVARGLRNSLGLAVNPQTQKLYQAENSLDLPDENLPFEEINLIEPGRHYGWPYCHSNGIVADDFKSVVTSEDCRLKYAPALINMPAHVAPLGLLFYQSERLSDLKNKLLVSWHGYRDAGQKVVAYTLDSAGLPVSPKPEMIIFNWGPKEKVRPKGAPVGLTELHDGRLLVIDDKNSSILILDQGENFVDHSGSSEIQITENQIRAMTPLMPFLKNNCVLCHSELNQSNERKMIESLISRNMVNRTEPFSSLLLQRIEKREMPMNRQLGEVEYADVLKKIQFLLQQF